MLSIEKADGSAGWVAPSDNDGEGQVCHRRAINAINRPFAHGNSRQILIRPLISTRSLPPQYPPDQVFQIVALSQ